MVEPIDDLVFAGQTSTRHADRRFAMRRKTDEPVIVPSGNNDQPHGVGLGADPFEFGST
jgi:hypothetical protein